MRLRPRPSSVLNVAEAKQQFSTLLGRVAFGGETIVITRRGRPMGKLVPVSEGERPHLSAVRGWLDADDSFFDTMEDIAKGRALHVPRVVRKDRR